jgi:ureidoacrylate peracid hydrolase
MTITVAARPGPVELEPASTALIVVDMQHDFASPGGMFDRAGIDIAPIRRIVEPITEVISAARRSGMPVCYLKMGFDPDLVDAGHPDGPTWIKHVPLHAGATCAGPDGEPSRVLIRGTWNTRIIDEVAPMAGDVVVEKSRYSGFHGTDLEHQLRSRDIETLLFVGATTSVCVESTLRDAMARDFHCVVLEDCVAEPIGADLARSNHEASLLTIELLFGSVTTSGAFVAAQR